MQRSKTIQYKDFSSKWYKKWSLILKQDKELVPGQPIHNKAWQNAVILETLSEGGLLKRGKKAIGFGVGMERIPSALASLGVKVTATDQDFEQGKKGGWNNGQLANSGNDLNMYGVCPTKKFNDNVTYKNCDMNNLNTNIGVKYDIVWSNCALGHLGSIDKGLGFIEESLKFLKPGGIAVHTTEINVLSNEDTVDTGGTVIFRLKDLTQLFYKLRKQGFICSPLVFNLGDSPEDHEVSFHPYRNDKLLKIHIGGHILSQIVLVIQKPNKKTIAPSFATARKKLETQKNLKRLEDFKKKNIKLTKYLDAQRTVSLSGPKPLSSEYKLTMGAGKRAKVRVSFKNFGDFTFYDPAHVHYAHYPLIIVTASPVNRDSTFATKEWASKNRPSLYLHKAEQTKDWDALTPGSEFYADVYVKAPSKPGIYNEKFCLALEGRGTLETSDFVISVKVE